jgi:hypothetical protein
MVPDLGLGPEIWLLLTLLLCVSIFVSFRRPWSLRNLDLLLLFVLAPGIMALVGGGQPTPIVPYLWLFLGTGLWLVRCLVDLGLPRRPALEPNLNVPGLTCLSLGMIALIVAETINLPIREGDARNPAASEDADLDAHGTMSAVSRVPAEAQDGALPVSTRPGVVRWRSTQIIVSRVLAGLAHIGVVGGLIVLARRHFGRPVAGLSAAALYLVLPYTRIEAVDSGQVLPAALIVLALIWHEVPGRAGAAIGFAAGWMPACVGLVPLWIGFYRGRHARDFAMASLGMAGISVVIGRSVPGLSRWAEAMGARGLAEAGLLPGLEPVSTAGLWSGIDPVYRLPVLVGYLAMVLLVSVWPLKKNLGELIALSAALLLASQFWYLEKGGTMVLLYLPLLLLMMFRPNLSSKHAPRPAPRSSEESATSLLRA